MAVSGSRTLRRSNNHHQLILLFVIATLLILPPPGSVAASCYTAIFSFGDSLTDTGNVIRLAGGLSEPASRLPYGETYFHRPTGRCSDGRLIVDFLAQGLGLPLVPPYLAGESGADFSYGANFAVGGAKALGDHFHQGEIGGKDYSLNTQLRWFKQLANKSISINNEFLDTISSSLFLMGEMGANDYYLLLSQDGRDAEIRSLVPGVVCAIGSAVNDLVLLGANTIMVEGIFPMGCIPLFLTEFRSENAGEYDPRTGCIKWLNDFSEYHNAQLIEKLTQLQKLHPHVNIIYADIYGASMSIYESPAVYGIEVTLASCCGIGGPYNHTVGISCGDPLSKLCSDPSKYACWDGLHLTEAAYGIIAEGLLRGTDATPPLNQTCILDALEALDTII